MSTSRKVNKLFGLVDSKALNIVNETARSCDYAIHHLNKYAAKHKNDDRYIYLHCAIEVIEDIPRQKDNILLLVNTLQNLKAALIIAHLKTQELDKLLDHIILQIKHITYLSKIGDSDIDQHLDKAYGQNIKMVPLSKTSPREFFNYIINEPNSHNNPAERTGAQFRAISDEINYRDKLAIIYVSGGKVNPYGHTILKLGDHGYVHINTLYGNPQYLRDDQHFAAYLKAQGGRVVGIQPLHIRKPLHARAMLEKLLLEKWFWQMSHHNCLSFIHQIAFAGGIPPEELGYTTESVHYEPKLPIHFLQNAQNHHEQSVSSYREEYKKTTDYYRYVEEITPRFRKVIPCEVTDRLQTEMIDYYAMLRCHKLNEIDALSYVRIAYNLPSPSTLSWLKRKCSSIGYLPNLGLDNSLASFNVLKTALIGDHRVADKDSMSLQSMDKTAR